MPLANCWLGSGESSKVRAPRLRPWHLLQPSHRSKQINRRSREQVLQVGARQPDVARAAQVEGVGALGHRPLHSGSQRLALLKVWCLLPLPRCLQGQVYGFRMQG